MYFRHSKHKKSQNCNGLDLYLVLINALSKGVCLLIALSPFPGVGVGVGDTKFSRFRGDHKVRIVKFLGGRQILKEIKCRKPKILKKSPAASNVLVFLVKITDIS